MFQVSPLGYSNNFGEPSGHSAGVEGTKEGVQAEIINTTFRRLINRLVKEQAWLSRPENSAVHGDMRAFLAYMQHSHGAAFRRVVLSGLANSIPVETHRPETR